jgi:hypothetical protein
VPQTTSKEQSRQKATMAAAAAATIPEELSSLWKSLDPAIRAALIESETNAAATSSSSSSNNKAGLQGRRAKASSGPRIDTDAGDATTTLIGGSSFTKRESNPGWIKVRSDVYDAVKARRDAELSGKVPVDIDVTLPDGKILVEDKVR